MDPDRLYWVVVDPVWSPDGKKIVFDLFVWASAKAGRQGLFTANANGSGVRAATKPTRALAKSLDFPGGIDWGAATG
jgi:Tol biopolymer transport system component